MTVAGRSRRSPVSGYFYPSDPAGLRKALGVPSATLPGLEPAVAALVPHGPYRFAGTTLGQTLAAVRVPAVCIVLGSNHTGYGQPWSVLDAGAYRTPLGEVAVDEALAQRVLAACPGMAVDEQAHAGEHAVDVVLPALQLFGPAEVRVVPIIARVDDPATSHQVGQALAGVVREWPEPVLILGTVELTRYEPHAEIARKDTQIIDALASLDDEALVRTVWRAPAAVCGLGVMVAVVTAARALGASSGRCVHYATSAAAGGDPDSATGYVGMLFR
jgi:AmmeMemoRadiSam system protein B